MEEELQFVLTFNDLSVLRLPYHSMDIVENADGTIREVVLRGNPSKEQMKALKKFSKQAASMPRQTKLTERLNALFTQAEKNPGRPKRLDDAGGGLGIDLVVMADGTMRMNLHRESGEPSYDEMKLVVAQFPFGVAAENIKRFTHSGRFYLQCDLLLQKE